ncbi:MAG: hypothetical protein P8179_23740 [Candidatus Thiodiazotropha sp.]
MKKYISYFAILLFALLLIGRLVYPVASPWIDAILIFSAIIFLILINKDGEDKRKGAGR